MIDGTILGNDVGCRVGHSVGFSVGGEEGAPVCWRDGVVLGVVVLLGWVECCEEGAPEKVGCKDGCVLGWVDGIVDGAVEGSEDGIMLG